MWNTMHKFVEFAKTSMKFCNYEHTGSRSITLITGIDICVVVDTLRLVGLATDIYALKLTSRYILICKIRYSKVISNFLGKKGVSQSIFLVEEKLITNSINKWECTG